MSTRGTKRNKPFDKKSFVGLNREELNRFVDKMCQLWASEKLDEGHRTLVSYQFVRLAVEDVQIFKTHFDKIGVLYQLIKRSSFDVKPGGRGCLPFHEGALSGITLAVMERWGVSIDSVHTYYDQHKSESAPKTTSAAKGAGWAPAEIAELKTVILDLTDLIIAQSRQIDRLEDKLDNLQTGSASSGAIPGETLSQGHWTTSDEPEGLADYKAPLPN